MNYKYVIGFTILSCVIISSVESASSSSSRALALAQATHSKCISPLLPTSIMQLIMQYNGAPAVPAAIRHTLQRWEINPRDETTYRLYYNGDEPSELYRVYSPDHRHVAIVKKDATQSTGYLVIFNTTTRNVIASTRLNICPLWLSWSAHGNYVAYQTIEPLHTLQLVIFSCTDNRTCYLPTHEMRSFAWSPTADDTFAVLNQKFEVTLFKKKYLQTFQDCGTEIFAEHTTWVPCIPCKSIRTLIWDKAFSLIWDKALMPFHITFAENFKLVWTSKNTILVCSSLDGRAKSSSLTLNCDATTGEIVEYGTHSIKKNIHNAHMSVDNSYLAVAHNQGITVYGNGAPGKSIFNHTTSSPCNKLVWLNKNTLCVSTYGHTPSVMIINIETGAVRTLVQEEKFGTFLLQYNAERNELIAMPIFSNPHNNAQEPVGKVYVWNQTMDWETMRPYLGYTATTPAQPLSPVTASSSSSPRQPDISCHSASFSPVGGATSGSSSSSSSSSKNLKKLSH